MSVLAPTSASRGGGAKRLGTRVAAAVLALLVATPLLATVWTRSNLLVRIPKGGRVELENASYATRDWSVALTALEVREDSRPVKGTATVVWVFHYTNTDKEPHYVALTVRCLDARRDERTRFAATATLEANRPNGDKAEISAKVLEDNWRVSTSARIVVDFISTPQG